MVTAETKLIEKTSTATKRSAVRIIDGATSTEICRRGVELHPISWSGLTSLSNPELIKSIHLSYIRAGARIITSNTFASSRHILKAAGSEGLFDSVNRQSIEIAIAARKESGESDVLIAGSLSTLPPLNNPDSAPSGAVVERNYQDQAEILAQSGADLLLIEMQYDSDAAVPLIKSCLATGLPVWVGITASCRADGQLIAYRPPGKYTALAEESFESLITTVAGQPITAIGVMHTPITLLRQALTMLQEVWAGPTFAYPETGKFDEPNWDFAKSVNPDEFANQMCALSRSYSLAAIGGCCGTTPAHIEALVAALHRQTDEEM